MALYSSLIESKLLYGLSTMVLTVCQKRILNGFQSRCLRRIFGIKPSYISRVSNACVLEKAVCVLATNLLLRRQMRMLGKVLRAPEGHPLQKSSFIPGTNRPATDQYVRRVGRPAKEWIPEMMREAESRLGSTERVLQTALNKKAWDTFFAD